MCVHILDVVSLTALGSNDAAVCWPELFLQLAGHFQEPSLPQTYQAISHIALIILRRMIEAATTSTSTSTSTSTFGSYTHAHPVQQQQREEQVEEEEQHEHLTSLLGFRSEPGHLKCRSSLRGREWHIESALQSLYPPSFPLSYHAPFLSTHTHTHRNTNLPPPCPRTTPIRFAMCVAWSTMAAASSWAGLALLLSLSIFPLSLFASSAAATGCKNKLTWKLKKAKKKIL